MDDVLIGCLTCITLAVLTALRDEVPDIASVKVDEGEGALTLEGG